MTLRYGPPRAFRTVIPEGDTIHYWAHRATHIKEIEMKTRPKQCEIEAVSQTVIQEMDESTTLGEAVHEGVKAGIAWCDQESPERNKNCGDTPKWSDDHEGTESLANAQARNPEDRHLIMQEICNRDIQTIHHKNATYKDSWCKRGGVDTYMMLARKWDRLENMLQQPGVGLPEKWNILQYLLQEGEHPKHDHLKPGDPPPDDTALAQVQDLRRYLLLVEMWLIEQNYGNGEPCTAVEGRKIAVRHDWRDVPDPGHGIGLMPGEPTPKAAEDAYRESATEHMAPLPCPAEGMVREENPNALRMWYCYDGSHTFFENGEHVACPDCGAECGTMHEINCPRVTRIHDGSTPGKKGKKRCTGCGAAHGEFHQPSCTKLETRPTGPQPPHGIDQYNEA